MFATASAADPMSVGTLLAWTLSIIAALVGTTMVVVGMIDEVACIVRRSLQRTIKRRRTVT
jgi:hypothetical protein